MKISYLFAKQMGFDNHQVAVTRKDTDVHIIANRINLYGCVQDGWRGTGLGCETGVDFLTPSLENIIWSIRK